MDFSPNNIRCHICYNSTQCNYDVISFLGKNFVPRFPYYASVVCQATNEGCEHSSSEPAACRHVVLSGQVCLSGQLVFYAVNIGRNMVTRCCLISSVYEQCLRGGSVTSVLFMRSKLAHYSIYFIVFIVFFIPK